MKKLMLNAICLLAGIVCSSAMAANVGSYWKILNNTAALEKVEILVSWQNEWQSVEYPVLPGKEYEFAYKEFYTANPIHNPHYYLSNIAGISVNGALVCYINFDVQTYWNVGPRIWDGKAFVTPHDDIYECAVDYKKQSKIGGDTAFINITISDQKTKK
jgi:hypothetical protein